MLNCHCDRCRRTSGHFVAATACPRVELVFETDEGLRWYEPAAGVFYGFCGLCGSSLFFRTADSDGISIMAGTLDQPTGLTTAQAWFVAEAGDYHRLDEQLEQFETEPG